jgi:glycosyltransferase involved in cell wall biosynthesis
MNILFVHYGTFSANSMNHIGPFAAELKKLGHDVAITLPDLDPSFSFFPYQEVSVYSYEDFLRNPMRFSREGPDIVHVWTPREVVRQFVERLGQLVETRCIIHLEDDEEAIRSESQINMEGPLYRTDPLHGPWFMKLADSFTIIIDSLSRKLPKGGTSHTLEPGFDLRASKKNQEPRFDKSTFGIPARFKIICYPGSASGPNSEDLCDLYTAIHLLNEHGTPTILMKTGFPDPKVRKSIPEGADKWIRDVGFLPRDQLWRLIEMSDVVVQPGRINDYNEYRLPSKLPDFLCLGRPLVTTRTNLGKRLIHNNQALLLEESSAEEIAARCQELYSDPVLAQKISKAGQIAGQQWFDLIKNTSQLAKFYEETMALPLNSLAAVSGNQIESAVKALEIELSSIEKPSQEAEQIGKYLKGVQSENKKRSAIKRPVPQVQLQMQVYYPQEPEKLELGSLRIWYRAKKRFSCLIPFSPPQALEWLRLDPGQFPGTYLLKSWSLLDPNQAPIFDWKPNADSQVTCHANGASLGATTDDGQEVWSLTHDPQLLFAPLPELEISKIQWLKIEIFATEIESPLSTPLTLKRRPKSLEEKDAKKLKEKIDSLLQTLGKRKSFFHRIIERLKK